MANSFRNQNIPAKLAEGPCTGLCRAFYCWSGDRGGRRGVAGGCYWRMGRGVHPAPPRGEVQKPAPTKAVVSFSLCTPNLQQSPDAATTTPPPPPPPPPVNQRHAAARQPITSRWAGLKPAPGPGGRREGERD